MDRVDIGKIGKSVSSGINEERRNHAEEELFKLIIKCLARCQSERHLLLATAEEENQCVQCIDDITSKELPWSEVR